MPRFPDLAHQEVYDAVLDSFLLGQTAAEALQVALTAVTQLQAAVTALSGDVTVLKAQVAALTPTPTTGTVGGTA